MHTSMHPHNKNENRVSYTLIHALASKHA